MPTDIKKAITCLVLSFICMLIADLVDFYAAAGVLLFDFIVMLMSLLWGAVLVWLIIAIRKRKNVLLSLFAVSAVMIYFLVEDFLASGFVLAQVFYALEIVFFLLPVYFLQTKAAKEWRE